MSERVQRMARMYTEEGLSYAEIARHFDVTRQRVHQLIGDIVEPRPHATRRATVQALAAAHRRVMANESTLAEEAERLGYASENSIRGSMAKQGLKFAERERPSRSVLAPHGTAQRYRQGCHCDECRAANTEYNRELRNGYGDPPTHSESGYRNYGCRCKVCTEAHSVAQREYRARRRRQRPRRGTAAAGRRITS